MGKTKYITSIGTLLRKDNSLCFRKDNKNVYIPIENINEIYLLNEVTFNSKLLDFLMVNNVVLHIFNYYGGYSGTFYPKEKHISGKLLVKQVNAFNERRIEIAKPIVEAIGINMIEVLYHYYKHGIPEVKDVVDWLRSDFIEKLNESDNIKNLLSTEGEAWYKFYSTFKYFLNEDFVMNKRVKRPPDNPVNALISFGNTLLYSKTIAILYQTHLDQTISFLHEPSESRFSLSLDISEAFKLPIVFKTIFELVNNRKLKVEKHFDKQVNYCILNEEGRNIFIEAFENRMDSVFENKKLKRKTSYRTAIKLDGYKLIKAIYEKEDFKPFSLKEMK